MIFKDPIIEKEYSGCPLLLKIIVGDLEQFSKDKYNIEPVMTRVLEAIPGDSSVHEDYRAVDIRQQHDGSFMYTPEQQQEILDYINTKYKRNDNKPTALCHSFNGSPYHFHIQVAVFVKAYMP
jgi:hypothetical protein